MKVPFNLREWQVIAAEKHPNGLPEPHSDDPTQWLFKGEVRTSTQPLQVAVARLLGYRWPEQPEAPDEIDALADDDGIVCIPSVRGEEPAAEQLLALLTAAGVEPNVDLDDWLRNEFFEAHCKLFHDRPFIWHIWDGRKRDGFHALVNYHRLCEANGPGRRLLENLAYAYLGEWLTRQKDGVKRGEEGAEGRLAAALELQNRLKAILEGEPPFDVFVRWKPLAEQPVGWAPDINDGVRMNIRPFLASDLPGGRTGAGVLRFKPNIKWGKDRGKEPQRSKDEYPWFWNWDEQSIDF
ncbi:MAG: SAM-dependent DNA methyltransferase, partial [Candidatus Saccharimonadales bacterium]